jgi:glycosyltransferase involved in cell wall biosynthesis
MSQPRVTIVTPTWNREAFLPAIHACVQRQNYENFEWLVHDDSELPSAELAHASWDKLRYIHSPERMTIGEKRNALLEQATGEIIVNFDDDDYYGPDYVSNRVAALIESEKPLSISAGFFAYHLNTGHFGYYRPHHKKGIAFQFHRGGVEMVQLDKVNIPFIHLCYGWSYVFRRELWDRVRFADVSMFEDRAFVQKVMEFAPVHFYESRTVDAIHAIHNLSSSNCFPQFIIPPFMMTANSPLPAQHIGWLAQIVQSLNQKG